MEEGQEHLSNYDGGSFDAGNSGNVSYDQVQSNRPYQMDGRVSDLNINRGSFYNNR
jgi:hypothetical protein